MPRSGERKLAAIKEIIRSNKYISQVERYEAIVKLLTPKKFHEKKMTPEINQFIINLAGQGLKLTKIEKAVNESGMLDKKGKPIKISHVTIWKFLISEGIHCKKVRKDTNKNTQKRKVKEIAESLKRKHKKILKEVGYDKRNVNKINGTV